MCVCVCIQYQEALAASAAALARTADMESHINDLTMRLTEAERACEAHTARVAELSAAHTQLTHEAEDLRKRLGDTQTELKKTATRVRALLCTCMCVAIECVAERASACVYV